MVERPRCLDIAFDQSAQSLSFNQRQVLLHALIMATDEVIWKCRSRVS